MGLKIVFITEKVLGIKEFDGSFFPPYFLQKHVWAHAAYSENKIKRIPLFHFLSSRIKPKPQPSVSVYPCVKLRQWSETGLYNVLLTCTKPPIG